MSRVEELLAIIHKRQQALMQEMNTHEGNVAALAELARSMKESDSFDSEDRTAVEREIACHEQNREQLAAQFQKEEETRKVHEELFCCLNAVIMNRQETLDKADGRTKVLAAHPELLGYLARKQLSLQQIIDDKLEGLGASLETEIKRADTNYTTA